MEDKKQTAKKEETKEPKTKKVATGNTKKVVQKRSSSTASKEKTATKKTSTKKEETLDEKKPKTASKKTTTTKKATESKSNKKAEKQGKVEKEVELKETKKKATTKKAAEEKPKKEKTVSEKTKTEKSVKKKSDDEQNKKEETTKKTTKSEENENKGNNIKKEKNKKSANLNIKEMSQIQEVVHEELKKNKKIPEDKEKKILNKVFQGIALAVVILFYFNFIVLGFINIASNIFLTDLKVFSVAILLISIGLFEIAYKKESLSLAVNGIEILILAFVTMALLYINLMWSDKFIPIAVLISYLFAIYYVAKTIIVYRKMQKQYFVDSMKEIIKK